MNIGLNQSLSRRTFLLGAGVVDFESNYPPSNLYLSMLQRLGIEADPFSTSKGTMRGLELA